MISKDFSYWMYSFNAKIIRFLCNLRLSGLWFLTCLKRRKFWSSHLSKTITSLRAVYLTSCHPLPCTKSKESSAVRNNFPLIINFEILSIYNNTLLWHTSGEPPNLLPHSNKTTRSIIQAVTSGFKTRKLACETMYCNATMHVLSLLSLVACLRIVEQLS